jgi:hypothetical protein
MKRRRRDLSKNTAVLVLYFIVECDYMFRPCLAILRSHCRETKEKIYTIDCTQVLCESQTRSHCYSFMWHDLISWSCIFWWLFLVVDVWPVLFLTEQGMCVWWVCVWPVLFLTEQGMCVWRVCVHSPQTHIPCSVKNNTGHTSTTRKGHQKMQLKEIKSCHVKLKQRDLVCDSHNTCVQSIVYIFSFVSRQCNLKMAKQGRNM